MCSGDIHVGLYAPAVSRRHGTPCHLHGFSPVPACRCWFVEAGSWRRRSLLACADRGGLDGRGRDAVPGGSSARAREPATRRASGGDVPLGFVREPRRPRGGRRDRRGLHHPCAADPGAHRVVHRGQPGPGGARADPPGHAPRPGRAGDLPDRGRPDGGVPGLGHPGDGPPVRGPGARFSRLHREPVRPFGPFPPADRPLPPDQQGRGPAREPARQAGRRRAGVRPPPVRRAVRHADGGGVRHLLHGRHAPAAAQCHAGCSRRPTARGPAASPT